MSNSFEVFVRALDTIEQNLQSEITQEQIAYACCCSLSSLQKTWRCVTHMSIKEYISKRRLTLAGRDMLENGLSVLDTAMKYGYNSNEVFTRAFTKVWGMTPSAFKKSWKGSCLLYPPLNPEYTQGDEIAMNVRKYDIREFYDYLKTQSDTYVLCFDIVDLMPINQNIGRDMGDKCILETLRRITEAAGEERISLRIGGDEFVMLTESKDLDTAAALADEVLKHNGEKVSCGSKETALSLRCGVIKISSTPRYSTLYTNFTNVIERVRSTGKVEFLK